MVTLQKMTPAEFQQYLETAVADYAKEKVSAGNWEEKGSLQRAQEEFSNLLPDGENSENNYLYTILNESAEHTGIIWLAKQSSEKAFIYDIRILEEHQGKGYGKEAMKEIEEKAKQIGVNKIGLHVFGHNKIARGLYEKIGYKTTNVVMEKEIF
ncbi:GNAT family N-acetyltransferase [Bacillus sp. Marseille-Q1617]|uniref:GNAT family N-acetyltransferase n=1 Tax=Bacillus sp. Marseille-Q1617 TaxID=2736887 RepID=UPI00158B6D83|nr:GNAT family N-acetyltransferase [Bacillus sp. Marseille-Q1617]